MLPGMMHEQFNKTGQQLARFAFFGLALAALWIIYAPNAASAQSGAQSNKPQATFKNWRLYVETDGANKQCFIVGEPNSSRPSNVRRGNIFLTIAHRPGQGVRNEVSVRIGYPFSEDSNPFARIGSDTFRFFTGVTAKTGAAEWAWLESLTDQPRMVTAMKRGNELVFKGTSKRGTLTTDSYSLLGVTAAMRALDAACPASK
jgi:hypothetical protein